ncbi:MAG TPA: ATP-binding protein [bacterium]|nr:ATP-binding protein [bacterium]
MRKTEPILKGPEMLAAFQAEDAQVRLSNIRIGCYFVIFGMPGGTSLDQQVYPAMVPYFLKVRLICGFLGLVTLGLLYLPFAKKHLRLFGVILPLLPVGCISWMIYSTEGIASPYYAGILMTILAVGLVWSWTFLENLTTGILSIGTYYLACRLHGPADIAHGIGYNNFYFLVLVDLLVILMGYFNEQLRLREFALRFELNQNKQKLEESNRKLVELDQMKSRFFANISHELRTPLTLLIGPLESLQQNKAAWMDEETKSTLKMMQGNSMRLLKLINDLLDLVKMESGRMEIKKEPVEMESFLKGLVQSVTPAAQDKRVKLSLVTRDLATVLLDRDKLEKMVLNLAFNAIKFTPSGGKVEVSAWREGPSIALRVKDTGVGISTQNLPFIFDRFWQADSSANRKYQGTGIGLALVKELAEVQGGRVSVESQLGQGTTMTVTLPYEEASVPVAALSHAAGAEEPPAPEPDEWLSKLYRRAELFPTLTALQDTMRADSYAPGRKPKLLVADDEPDMLGFLKIQLQKQYEVVEATDGQQALEKARQFLPDLILLDMMMPEKDGIEVCRELKNQVSTQAIPIILLTARADDETKMRALETGASDFLSKPFSSTELHVRVKNLVESHHYQRDLAREKNALESTLEQLKETEGQLVQNEKMASLGRLSAGLIHEINNPLNYAAQALYVLRTKKDQLPEAERAGYAEVLADIEDGIQRVKRIVTDLRTFTHPHMGGGKDLVEVRAVVETAARFLSHDLRDPVKLEMDIPADQTMQADRNKMVQVFINLIQNACDALKDKKFPEGEGPRIWVEAREEKQRVLIRVRDNGTGIDPKILDKIFDPFFTTKDVGQGMGLGLSLCFRILQEQEGRLSVKSELGKGAEFTLDLPARA